MWVKQVHLASENVKGRRTWSDSCDTDQLSDLISTAFLEKIKNPL